MSVEQTRVSEQHYQYLSERTQPEDEFLRTLRADAVAAGIPAISIGAEQASFIQILLRAARAKDVLELGTLAGYSAIAMARALPADGHVHTVEYSQKHADFASAAIARSDAAGKVTVHCGRGQDVLPTLAAHSIDAAFLDADKSGYPVYLEECFRIVRPGGMVMVDNAFAFGQLFDDTPSDGEVGAVRAFNEIMAKEKRLQSIITPFGDGMWLGVML